MAQVNVTINGRVYRMACNDGEEDHLTGLADKFNGYIDELRGSFGEIGDMRLTVMAGITVTDELSELQRRMRGLEAEVASLRESRDAVLERFETTETSIAETIERTAERIEELSSRLNRTGRDA
ncbi:MAG TPA: cell division protein ZapA [Hyphomicrobiales bacterium]|nr:cell division protein ZapA [Hyphomicrobiales bacterium]